MSDISKIHSVFIWLKCNNIKNREIEEILLNIPNNCVRYYINNINKRIIDKLILVSIIIPIVLLGLLTTFYIDTNMSITTYLSLVLADIFILISIPMYIRYYSILQQFYRLYYFYNKL